MKKSLSNLMNLAHRAKSITFNTQTILEQARELKKQNRLNDAINLLEETNNKKEDGRIVHLLSHYLLEAADYQRIVELPTISQYNPRNFAIAHALLANSDNQTVCLKGHQPLHHAAYICMVKDEEDIILWNLVWHYALGFRKFFIINNLSTDNTEGQIKFFEKICSDTHVFVLHDPVIAHFQSKKTTGACRFVLSLWPDIDWIALVDADEFLCPTQALHTILANFPDHTDAIVVSKSVYHLVSSDSLNASELFFKRIQHRKPISHISNKVIVRANLHLSVSQGNHRIFDHNNEEIKNYIGSPKLSYREFPIRSREHFLRKIINGGKAIAEAKQQGFNQVGGTHWEALYKNIYLKEGEEGMNRKFSAILTKNSKEASLFDPLPLEAMINALECTAKEDLLTRLHHPHPIDQK